MLYVFAVLSNPPDGYYTDLQRGTADPDVWEWGDGSLLTYDPWRKEQPDDTTQTIGVMSPSMDLEFFDGWDHVTRPFICEK